MAADAYLRRHRLSVPTKADADAVEAKIDRPTSGCCGVVAWSDGCARRDPIGYAGRWLHAAKAAGASLARLEHVDATVTIDAIVMATAALVLYQGRNPASAVSTPSSLPTWQATIDLLTSFDTQHKFAVECKSQFW